MNQRISLLGVVLGAQLALAVFLTLTTSGVGGVTSSEPLLHFDVKAINRVILEQPKKTALVLEHKGNTWSIPVLAEFPAFTSRVDALLERLSDLRKRLPVATSHGAIARFKVSPTDYEHKLVLTAGDKTVATLWLGGSSGLRQIYARANDEDAVYSVDISAYEIDSDPNQWADKTILNLRPEEITEITLSDAHLMRVKETAQEKDAKKDSKENANQPSKWLVDGLAAGEEINAAAINTLVSQIASLGFDAVLGKENKPEYRQEESVFKVSVTTQSGEIRNYVFSTEKPATPVGKDAQSDKEKAAPTEKGQEYILKTSASPYYFRIADITVKELLGAQRNKLITPPKSATTTGTSPALATPAATPTTAKPPETQLEGEQTKERQAKVAPPPTTEQPAPLNEVPTEKPVTGSPP